jgi:hypothetical protein
MRVVLLFETFRTIRSGPKTWEQAAAMDRWMDRDSSQSFELLVRYKSHGIAYQKIPVACLIVILFTKFCQVIYNYRMENPHRSMVIHDQSLCGVVVITYPSHLAFEQDDERKPNRVRSPVRPRAEALLLHHLLTFCHGR